jgi:hypothetical protein
MQFLHIELIHSLPQERWPANPHHVPAGVRVGRPVGVIPGPGRHPSGKRSLLCRPLAVVRASHPVTIRLRLLGHGGSIGECRGRLLSDRVCASDGR